MPYFGASKPAELPAERHAVWHREAAVKIPQSDHVSSGDNVNVHVDEACATDDRNVSSTSSSAATTIATIVSNPTDQQTNGKTRLVAMSGMGLGAKPPKCR